jgi:hypothetical protein
VVIDNDRGLTGAGGLMINGVRINGVRSSF